MRIEIVPEPSDEEREAVATALRSLLRRGTVRDAYRSAWRRAALRDVREDQALEPRRSWGATRA